MRTAVIRRASDVGKFSRDSPLRVPAAVHVARVQVVVLVRRKDISRWWCTPEVQGARKLWADQFARTSRLWWWQWVVALSKLKHTG